MLIDLKPNLFLSPADVLVNTVNTVGVMGKGIAKDIRAALPDVYHHDTQRHKAGELAIGRLDLVPTPRKWILNFPAKRHWRSSSLIKDIEAGLQTFVETYQDLGIDSIAFPPLGCGIRNRYLDRVSSGSRAHLHDHHPV